MSKENMSNELRLMPTIEILNDYIKNQYWHMHKGEVTAEIISWECRLNPNQPMLDFYGVRKSPKEYIRKELEWYKSQKRNVGFISQHAKLWKDISGYNGEINSNYGWCVFSDENHNQFKTCVEKLRRDPGTRQATMIYTRPSIHKESTINGMKDMLCTNGVQLFIRNKKLIYIVNQRSCDFIYGFFNDFAWHCHVYTLLLNALTQEGVNVDRNYLQEPLLIYKCDTLHVYKRHFEIIENIIKASGHSTFDANNNVWHNYP